MPNGPIDKDTADQFSQGMDNTTHWENLLNVMPWLKTLVQPQNSDSNQLQAPQANPVQNQLAIDALRSASNKRQE